MQTTVVDCGVHGGNNFDWSLSRRPSAKHQGPACRMEPTYPLPFVVTALFNTLFVFSIFIVLIITLPPLFSLHPKQEL